MTNVMNLLSRRVPETRKKRLSKTDCRMSTWDLIKKIIFWYKKLNCRHNRIIIIHDCAVGWTFPDEVSFLEPLGIFSRNIHHRISIEMENWIALHPPPASTSTVDFGLCSRWNVGRSHTTPGNKLSVLPYSVDGERKEEKRAVPRVSNIVATGITSDLTEECDLKAFYDRNYFFTIFPSTRSSWGCKEVPPKNLIFTACFTARFSSISLASWEICMHSSLHFTTLSRFAPLHRWCDRFHVLEGV